MVTGAEETWCSVVARSTICKLPNLYPGKTMNSECTSGLTAAARRIGLTSHSPLGLSLVEMEKSFLGRWGKLNTVMWSLQIVSAQRSDGSSNFSNLYRFRRQNT